MHKLSRIEAEGNELQQECQGQYLKKKQANITYAADKVAEKQKD